jgi:hypothetical protein
LVFAGATGILAARMLAWPPSFAQDTWVYTLSGQALASGRRPPVSLTSTTPKPLATLLALLVSPLPPARAMAIVTVVFAALLFAATFTYGYRQGGALGAFAAVTALAFLPALSVAFRNEQTDVISAALLVTAIVSGPRARIVCLTLMGLLRPQAWLLAGIAGYLASTRRLPRRILTGACCALLPAALWLLADAIVNGGPLVSYRANERINRHVPWHSLHISVRYFISAMRVDSGRLILVAGLVGFCVAAGQRRWRDDPFPAWVLVVLPAALIATWLHMPYNIRYTFPVAVLLPLGCAHLASLVRLPKPRWTRAAAVVISLGILSAAALTMPQTLQQSYLAKQTKTVFTAAPLVDRAFSCGLVRVHHRHPSAWFYALLLAVATRHPLTDFRYDPAMATVTDTETAGGVIFGPSPRRPVVTWLSHHGWRRTPIGLGSFWLSPRCRM